MVRLEFAKDEFFKNAGFFFWKKKMAKKVAKIFFIV